MGILLLAFAGLMLWLAGMQYRAVPRRMLQGIALGAAGYAIWLFDTDRDRAWEIRWVFRAMLRAALGVVHALIP